MNCERINERTKADWQIVLTVGGGASSKNVEYVWSAAYVDAMVCRNRDNNLALSDGYEERIYVIQDASWNVTAIVDTGGATLERYLYDPYGKPTYLSPTWGSPVTAAKASSRW